MDKKRKRASNINKLYANNDNISITIKIKCLNCEETIECIVSPYDFNTCGNNHYHGNISINIKCSKCDYEHNIILQEW